MSNGTKNGERLSLHMRDLDSSLFSEAFFVLRDCGERNRAPIGDMVTEARRIIRVLSDDPTSFRALRRREEIRVFFSGMFAGVAAVGIMILVAALCAG